MNRKFLFIILLLGLLFNACEKKGHEIIVPADKNSGKCDTMKVNPDDIGDPNDETDDSLYWHTFYLEKLLQENCSGIEEWIGSGSASGQGFDIFGNYLIGFTSSMDYFRVSDMKNRLFLGRFLSGFGHIEARHANCQNFTNEYLEAGDEFPLLLVSGNESRAGDDLLGVAYLIRIERNEDSFSASLVQTIKTVPGIYIDKNGSNFFFNKYSNIMVDRSDGHIYVINNSDIYEMNLPPLYDEQGHLNSIAELTVDKVIRHFQFTYSDMAAQGASIYNGVAYIASGTSRHYLDVVDLTTEEHLTKINLSEIGFDYEPEDISFWRGSMVICSSSQMGIYRVYWDK